MRPVIKISKLNTDGSPLSFGHWQDAKTDLLNEIGKYCSFCEREGYRSSLHVEHILPKGNANYAHLVYQWGNFLLACINCNSIKGIKDYDIAETYLPHLNNLLLTIEFKEGGAIHIKDNLPKEQQRRTLNFISLTGIDRDPSHPQYSDKDDRWDARMKVWDIANKFLEDYKKNEIKLQRIIDIAHYSGYWSVWMQVFQEYNEVRKELIRQFPGTANYCFDKDSIALPRNGDAP